MVVPNEQLKELTIEKPLGTNGGSPYLPKGGEPGFDPNIKKNGDPLMKKEAAAREGDGRY